MLVNIMKLTRLLTKKGVVSFWLFVFIINVVLVQPACIAMKLAPKNDALDAIKAVDLNTISAQSLGHLDELNSIVQYLGLALNKGAIKINNKSDAQNWIQEHQRIIRSLKMQYNPKVAFAEDQLYSICVTIKLLAKHISDTIESNLSILTNFEVPQIKRSVIQNTSIRSLKFILEDNKSSIETLKTSAHKAGLTKINLLARRIDEINEKYKVGKVLTDYLPIAGALAATAIYLTPENYAKHIPGVCKLKDRANIDKWYYIGTSNLDPSLPDNEKQQQRDANGNPITPRNKGWFGKGMDFMNDRDVEAAAKLLLGVGAWALARDSSSIPIVGPVIGSAKSALHSQWQRLKGFSGPNNATFSIVEDITLDDERIIGLDDQIEELRNLVEYVANPEIYDRSNSKLEKGIIIVGPSRNGKTHLARALAGSIDKMLKGKGVTRAVFKEIKWDEVRYTRDSVKTIIEQARKNAPCILFIDELHNLPLQTKELQGDTLTEFLTGMSGINSENDAKHQVILLAATNRPEMLDGALLQPGRFGTIIRVEKPSYENRKKYFEVMFKYDAVDTSDIDIDSLVRQTEDCSYGDLEGIIKSARFIARKLAKGVSQEHLQERIDTHVHRLKNNIKLTEREKYLVAVHQAGHALMNVLLEPDNKLEFVTLRGKWPKITERRYWDLTQQQTNTVKSYNYGTIYTYSASESLKSQSNLEREKLCKIKLAGAMAEQVLLGGAHGYHENDRAKARKLAKLIILKGDNETLLSKQAQQDCAKQAEDLLKRYEKEVEEELLAHKQQLEEIANELTQKITLTKSDIEEILDPVLEDGSDNEQELDQDSDIYLEANISENEAE